VPSETIKLTARLKLKEAPKGLDDLFTTYHEIVNFLISYAYENSITSFYRLKSETYKILRERYPELPSHYIYTACQDAVTRVKSFLRLKRKGIAKTESPEVKNVSLWLDDVLWDFENFPRLKEGRDRQNTLFIRISVKRGRIMIPLKPHKLFFKYLSNGWKIRANVRLRIDYERRVVHAIFTFQKEVEYEEKEPERCIAVDCNLNNVAFGNYKRIYVVRTDVGLITEKYTNIMRNIQKKHLVGWETKRPSRRGKKLLGKFEERKANKIKDTL